MPNDHGLIGKEGSVIHGFFFFVNKDKSYSALLFILLKVFPAGKERDDLCPPGSVSAAEQQVCRKCVQRCT
jgi:hypothetical protein